MLAGLINSPSLPSPKLARSISSDISFSSINLLLVSLAIRYFTLPAASVFILPLRSRNIFLVKSHIISVMNRRTSAAIACTVLVFLSLQASAFNLRMYGGERCNALPVSQPIGVVDGCRKTPGSGLVSIILKWANEDDNKLVLATYSDGNCCHARLYSSQRRRPKLWSSES